MAMGSLASEPASAFQECLWHPCPPVHSRKWRPGLLPPGQSSGRRLCRSQSHLLSQGPPYPDAQIKVTVITIIQHEWIPLLQLEKKMEDCRSKPESCEQLSGDPTSSLFEGLYSGEVNWGVGSITCSFPGCVSCLCDGNLSPPEAIPFTVNPIAGNTVRGSLARMVGNGNPRCLIKWCCGETSDLQPAESALQETEDDKRCSMYKRTELLTELGTLFSG